MKQISLLEQDTIDKIAAGEVVERPSSVVKELVENAIDAGSKAVTVEIKEGGISFIRITDNGEGIPKDQVAKAFLRHATSKIRSAEDLMHVGSLGFRGEALSSIAAVSQVELITRTADSLTGIRYVIEGGREKTVEEIGAPEGSTFLVRNIFYNTPARKKFLKTAATEAGYISDLVEHLALSHPEISFKFISNGQTKLHTSGNGRQKDIIYSIYGRDIAANVLPVEREQSGIRITGYIGTPLVSRGNRNFENYFINGRYVRSTIIAKAIEEAYKSFLMQHRYPFVVLCLNMPGEQLDVNVHPTKMELRFADQSGLYQFIYDTVRDRLTHKEMIPEVSIGRTDSTERKPESGKPAKGKPSYPEPFEKLRKDLLSESNSPYQPRYPDQQKEQHSSEVSTRNTVFDSRIRGMNGFVEGSAETTRYSEKAVRSDKLGILLQNENKSPVSDIPEQTTISCDTENKTTRSSTDQQLSLFEDRLLDQKNLPEHKLIGQVFDTYWIVQFRDSMYLIDQHAAHEKVMYERLTATMSGRQHTSQQISPPIVISLTLQEAELLSNYMELFEQIGFEISCFGGNEYVISAVPDNLFGFTEKDLFIDMIDSLSVVSGKPSADILNEKLASMACRSAVKGNHRLSVMEADALIRELLELENPYHCPHGRPTIISMSRQELEKKFKRIV